MKKKAGCVQHDIVQCVNPHPEMMENRLNRPVPVEKRIGWNSSNRSLALSHAFPAAAIPVSPIEKEE